MAFIMRYCKKMLNFTCKLVLLLSLCVCTAIANAEGIAVTKATIRPVDDAYEISADFKITLPPSVAEALKHGVTLNFVSELAITRSRWYWLDSDVVQNEQTTKLSYNALTQQYRISRGTLFQGFPTLEGALQVLGHQSSDPVSLSVFGGGSGYVVKMLRSETKYTAFAQMRLDISQLPKPLQVSALTDNDWNLASEKYSWTVPTELVEAQEKKKP